MSKVSFIRKGGRIIPIIKKHSGTLAMGAGAGLGAAKINSIHKKHKAKRSKFKKAAQYALGAVSGAVVGVTALKLGSLTYTAGRITRDLRKVSKMSKDFNKLSKSKRTAAASEKFLQKKGFSSLNFKKPKGPMQ